MAIVVLAANTILDDTSGLTSLNEISLEVLGESPLAGSVNLLAASNLVLGTTKGLESMRTDGIPAPHGDEHLANVDTSHGAIGLSECTTHTGLKPVSASARKHLVDTEHVERVYTDAHVERILTSGLGHILVARNTACLLYTSDAADEEDSVDLGGRRIIKKKKKKKNKKKKKEEKQRETKKKQKSKKIEHKMDV
eukprot:TRINITY_DN871_c0_g1_i4.p1 TRINITY_DN871_c0_g1~~TRINITY_DN871_c0_g1_i4.p1  ORF type:complete len:195 (-),score=39.88 TRINITY_DN871_c0_g1_i4:42-626(-)